MNRLIKKLEKIGRDPKTTAKSVGLRYVADSTPGYTRKKSGRGFSFYDADGKLVKDKELVQRFIKMVIPPAYTSVWISPFENSHLQFTGVDAAGRKQYRYHAGWNQIRNQSKYHRLQAFAAPQWQRRRCVSANVAAAERPHTASGAATQAHDNFLSWLTVLLANNLHAFPS